MKKNCRVFIFALYLLPALLYSQNRTQVTKRYQVKDPAGDYSKAMLILYSDNSFLNFELINDPIQKEWYIWYTTGKLTTEGSKIICNSVDSENRRSQIISEIKEAFKRRPDHSLINLSYEFVCEKFIDHIFLLSDNKAYDPEKKIEYNELH